MALSTGRQQTLLGIFQDFAEAILGLIQCHIDCGIQLELNPLRQFRGKPVQQRIH
jgi:hypothetical protein